MVGVARLQVIALAAVVAAATPAWADDLDGEAAARIDLLNRVALLEIRQKDFAAARKHLLEAVALSKRRGSTLASVLARTYFHLGALDVIARGDRLAARESFRRALELDLDLRPSAALRDRPDVTEVFREAADAGPCFAKCPLPATGDEPDPELPAQITGLDCRAGDGVEAGSALVVRCAVHESIEVTSLYLHVQSGAAPRFKDVMMRITDRGWWKGVVPAADLAGTSVRLYVDGRNSGGRRLRSELGDARRPTTVQVRPAPECRCAPPMQRQHLMEIER